MLHKGVQAGDCGFLDLFLECGGLTPLWIFSLDSFQFFQRDDPKKGSQAAEQLRCWGVKPPHSIESKAPKEGIQSGVKPPHSKKDNPQIQSGVKPPHSIDPKNPARCRGSPWT